MNCRQTFQKETSLTHTTKVMLSQALLQYFCGHSNFSIQCQWGGDTKCRHLWHNKQLDWVSVYSIQSINVLNIYNKAMAMQQLDA
jgi:hypothetical protein